MTERLLVRYINIYGSLEIHPIGLALRLIRRSRKLSIKEVSENLGIHRNTLRNYETGMTKIPMIVLIRLSELYDVELEII